MITMPIGTMRKDTETVYFHLDVRGGLWQSAECATYLFIGLPSAQKCLFFFFLCIMDIGYH